MSDNPDEPPKVAIVADTGATSARMLQALSPNGPHIRHLDLVNLTPQMTGKMGRAWSLNLVAARLKYALDPSQDGTIHVWVIEAPWAHPVWHSYTLAIVHLRPLAQPAPRPKIMLDGATHEFWLHALEPSEFGGGLSREKLILGGLFGRDGCPTILNPMQFGSQFIAASDADAIARVRPNVQAIIDGILSPDTDAFDDWKAIWGESLVRPPYRG